MTTLQQQILITIIGVLLTDLIEREPRNEVLRDMNQRLKTIFFELDTLDRESSND